MPTHCNAQSRLGLYIIVIVTMVNSCDANTKLDRLENKMKTLLEQTAIVEKNNH